MKEEVLPDEEMTIFEFEMQKTIELMRTQFQEQNFQFSGQPKEDKIYVWDLFNHITLPNSFIELSNWFEAVHKSEMDTKINDLQPGSNVSDFVKRFGGIPGTITSLHKYQGFVEQYSLGELEEDRELIENLIAELHLGVEAVKVHLKEKHKKREGRFIVPTYFCSLCWRRTKHNLGSIKDVKSKVKRESTYYCYYHHPKEYDYNNAEAKRALLSYISKNESNDCHKEATQYLEKKLKIDNLAQFLSRCFKSLVPEERYPNNLLNVTGNDWRILSETLVEHIKDTYPLVHIKIKEVDHKNFSSWNHWMINGFIKSLDKKEVGYWQKCEDNDWLIENDWKTLLKLSIRYEIYESAMSSRPKVGRPSVSNTLKEFIESYYSQHQSIPSTKLIKEKFGVSSPTIAKAEPVTDSV